MNRQILVGLIALASVFTVFLRVAPQPNASRSDDKSENQNPHDQVQDERIQALESRVKHLEDVLFATSKLEVTEAKRRLLEAQERLKEDKRLFLRGFITELRLSQAEFAVLQANRELELAKLESRSECKVAEIELIEAQRNLEIAEENLKHNRLLHKRGFTSPAKIASLEKQVGAAKTRLEIASKKMEAARNLLEQSKNKPEK